MECPGADAAGIGRLEALGNVRMFELLERGMRTKVALTGLSSIDQLKPDCVVPAELAGEPHVLSAFTLLNRGY